jgi:hypothetical protein
VKETIYTIPINAAFESAAQDGLCPVCSLHRGLEADSLEYILGAAMMEPDVRRETNRLGFCARHWEKMLAAQKRLPLALVTQSHLAELARNPQAKLADFESCYLCARVGAFLGRYYANIIYLWQSSPEFGRLFDSVPAICLRHSAGLVRCAKTALPKKESARFIKSMSARAEKSLSALHESVSVFCRSFDHRFANEELGEHKHSIERAAAYLVGEKL